MSLVFAGTPVRAVASRPRTSAPRRRASSVTIRRNAAMRARTSRRETSSANGLSAPARVPFRSASTRASSVSGRTAFSA